MEQNTFNSLHPKTRFKKYILNISKRPSHMKETSSVRISTSSHNTKNYSMNINSSSFIQTSKKNKAINKLSKTEIANQNLTRKTLKKIHRFSTEPSESEQQGIIKLKQHINSITKQCNRIESRYKIDQYSSQAKKKQTNRKFMMTHLSFCEIEEEKIEQQKGYLSNFQYLKKRASKMVPGINKALQTPQVGQNYLIKCFRMIDRVYQVLQQLQDLGYYRKNNKNMINFCTNRRLWLSQLFLFESTSNKDAFSIQTKWLVVPTSAQAKEKFAKYISSGMKVDSKALINDIQDLLDHIEQALVQKKLIQITKIQGYIGTRLKQNRQEGNENDKPLRVAKLNTQQCDFTQDIEQLEQRFGAMKIITKVSRRRYQDLNRTYQRLQCLL